MRFRPFLLSGEKRSSRVEEESRDLGEDDICLMTYRSSSQKSVRCVYCVVDFLRDFLRGNTMKKKSCSEKVYFTCYV